MSENNSPISGVGRFLQRLCDISATIGGLAPTQRKLQR